MKKIYMKIPLVNMMQVFLHLSAHTSNIVPGIFQTISHSPQLTKLMTQRSMFGVIVDHFVPAAMYKFPKASNGRSFQYKWLSKYPWLRYSEKADGGFCVACVLFSHSSSFRSDPRILVNTPLTDFKRALEKLNHHAESLSQNSHSEDGCIHQGNDR